MIIGSECSRCKTQYSRDEYRELELQPMGGSENARGNGNERVCRECGRGFFSEKWQQIDHITIDNEEVLVSTVHLIIPHGLDRNQWYETLVGPAGVVERYETEDEAVRGHEKYAKALEDGDFHYESTGERMVFDDA